MAKLVKIASNAGHIEYRLDTDLSMKVDIKSATVPVKNGSDTTFVNRLLIDVRKDVQGKSCDKACPPMYPALYTLKISGPNGSDMKDVYKVLSVILQMATDVNNSPKPFVIDSNEIEIK